MKPKGTKDIFGKRVELRTFTKNVLEQIAYIYNYNKIETPTFEFAETFTKSIGESSDIVTKEMYEFSDKKNRKFVLRPEGTAGVVRAFVDNKLYANKGTAKLFYLENMFRYERPQKGRQRQFTQFGIEAIGEKSPFIDCEVIQMANEILVALGLKKFKLVINSLGNKETRENYGKALSKYLSKYKDQLSQDSIKRLDKNPLRILDDKVDGKKSFIKNAPTIDKFYSAENKAYFATVTTILDSIGLSYEINKKLVRGLDYYSDTIFEFISTSDVSGSKDTIIGGGRYNGLVKQFGGPNLSGSGFGIGIERLVNELEEGKMNLPKEIDVFVANIAQEAAIATHALVHLLRTGGIITDSNLKPLKLTKAFDQAKKANAKFVVIAGLEELKKGKVIIKDQSNGKQDEISVGEELLTYLDKKLMEAEDEAN